MDTISRSVLDWRLIFRLSLGGAVIGILLGTGLLPLRFIPPAWLGLAFVWAIMISRHASQIPWRTALLTGALSGFIAGDLLALIFYEDFASSLIANNVTGNTSHPVTAVPRTGIITGSVMQGIMFALLAGFAAWLIGKLVPRPDDGHAAVALVDDSEE